MFRTLAMFPKTDEGRFDMNYFLDHHIPMIEALLGGKGLVGIEVEEGVEVEPPGPEVAYVVLASLTFDTLEALEGAMMSYSGELTKDFPNFTDLRPRIQVNRVTSQSYKAPRDPQQHADKGNG